MCVYVCVCVYLCVVYNDFLTDLDSQLKTFRKKFTILYDIKNICHSQKEVKISLTELERSWFKPKCIALIGSRL